LYPTERIPTVFAVVVELVIGAESSSACIGFCTSPSAVEPVSFIAPEEDVAVVGVLPSELAVVFVVGGGCEFIVVVSALGNRGRKSGSRPSRRYGKKQCDHVTSHQTLCP
jgi:hypothetical protein